MAYVFDANDEGLSRTTALANYNATYTFMCWLRLNTSPSGSTSIFIPSDGTISFYDNFAFDPGARRLNIGHQNGNLSGPTVLALNTWYHVAATRSAPNSVRACLNGVQEVIFTNDPGARTNPTIQEVSQLLGAPRHIPGRMSAIKLWDAALTDAEIAQEMMHTRPVRFENLNSWYPTFVGATYRNRDFSGNNRHWTEAVGVSEEDGPPIQW